MVISKYLATRTYAFRGPDARGAVEVGVAYGPDERRWSIVVSNLEES